MTTTNLGHLVDDALMRVVLDALGVDAATRPRELVPTALVRTFRVADIVVRIGTPSDVDGLAREAAVLSALSSKAGPPITPALVDHGIVNTNDGRRPWLAYAWQKGIVLDDKRAREDPGGLGAHFAALHATRVMDLWSVLPNRRPMTLLDTFKRVSDKLRVWMLEREADGLPSDLLVLTLSDLQRALRQCTIAQDRLFHVAKRRVLLHGRARPETIVRMTDADAPHPHAFVLLDHCALGDATEDLAAFTVDANFSDDEEDAFLNAYLDALGAHGRSDDRLLSRYFARKSIALLATPVEGLARMSRLKSGKESVLEDPVVAVEKLEEQTYAELVRAMNGLKGFVGGARPVTVREVMAMGRLVAFEELILDGRSFRIALSGLPYAGKTEVGAALARRLRHAYINTSVVSRALAVVESRLERHAREPRELVAQLFERGFHVEPSMEAPYYTATLDGEDVTLEIHEDKEQIRGAALLDDPKIRMHLRAALEARTGTDGIVVEGAYANDIIPGRMRAFHLTCDSTVRRARLMSHRPDLESDDAADVLLAQLDEASDKPFPDAIEVNCGARPAAAAALEILWHLLPASRRPDVNTHILSGRAPLYTR